MTGQESLTLYQVPPRIQAPLQWAWTSFRNPGPCYLQIFLKPSHFIRGLRQNSPRQNCVCGSDCPVMTRMSDMEPERLWGLFCSLSRCPPCTCATRERETELDPHLGPSLGPTLLQTRGCMVHPRVEKEEAHRPGRGQQACSQVPSAQLSSCSGVFGSPCALLLLLGVYGEVLLALLALKGVGSYSGGCRGGMGR